MKIIERIKNFFWFRKMKRWYEEYEQYLLPGALLIGLAIDALTFQNVDVDTAFSLLTFYLLLSASTIAFVHAYKEDLFPEHKFTKTLFICAPIVIQFTYGALLSAIFIFYFFSGTVWVSWPLFLILVLLMVVNDTFREYYLKAEVQFSVYYFILFLFLILTLPFLFDSIGVWVFLLSGLLSVGLFLSFLKLLTKYSSELKLKQNIITIIAIIIFVFINLLYFTNIIPPIPLSVRDSGVYYSVERTGSKYKVIEEKDSWTEYLSFENQVGITDNSIIYVYTSIFAPAELREKIVHEWYYYDDSKQKWINRDKLDFYILGGKQGGYRGYSLKRNVEQGDWKVEVKTQSGKVLDIIEFELVKKEDIDTKTKFK